MEWISKPFKQLSSMEIFHILQGRCAVFVVEQECAYQDADDLDPVSEHIFALEDGELVGCCRIVPPGARYADVSLGRIIVMPKYRRRGLASEMLNFAIRRIETIYGKCDICLSGQTYVRSLYESLGFAVCSAEYLEDGIPHVDMVRRAE